MRNKAQRLQHQAAKEEQLTLLGLTISDSHSLESSSHCQVMQSVVNNFLFVFIRQTQGAQQALNGGL